MKPIGVVKNDRKSAEDDYWGEVVSEINLDGEQFTEESLYGLEQFSHLEVVFFMDKVDPEQIQLGSRHPRDRQDWPQTGIFSQRAKARPNRIGVSRCQLLEVNGLKIIVKALDAIDQTPILDIKPYISEFAPIGEVRQPQWATELMEDYYKQKNDI